ncbi:MAG: TIGR02147 family protein [Fibrobacter sp.]|jgi:uncharacterized protein (TIGR02147 family)|nr:TIGR02147 family protein [Fibrobacter sp.]
MNTIYSYTCYREFIRDFLCEKKKKNSSYSSRCAAKKCGVQSGTFTRILNGTRGIGPSVLPKFIDWLGLRHREAEYFQLLVKFHNASTDSDKENLYKEILSFRQQMKHCIPEDKFHIFEQWYYIALYELIKIMPEYSTPQKLGAFLEPPVNETKTLQALEILEKAGLIKRTGNGYTSVGKFLSTGDKWESVAIHAFQVKMGELGASALNRFSKNERDISTLSVTLSRENFQKVTEIIRDAREKIREIEALESKPENVYQINFQVFPLTRRPERGEDEQQ